MNRSAWLVMALASSAVAQTFDVDGELGLDLVWGRRAEASSSDVVVRARTLEAPRGVRCDSGEFRRLAVTVLDRDCEVRLGSGQRRRLRVLLAGGRLSVTLPPANGQPAPLRFAAGRLMVNGREAARRLEALVLFEDGRYRLGRSEGRWWQLPDGIALDGVLGEWGRARLSADGLCLDLARGPLLYRLCFPDASAEDVAP